MDTSAIIAPPQSQRLTLRSIVMSDNSLFGPVLQPPTVSQPSDKPELGWCCGDAFDSVDRSFGQYIYEEHHLFQAGTAQDRCEEEFTEVRREYVGGKKRKFEDLSEASK